MFIPTLEIIRPIAANANEILDSAAEWLQGDEQ